MDWDDEVRERNATLICVPRLAQRGRMRYVRGIDPAFHFPFFDIFAYSIPFLCSWTSIISIAASSATDRHIKLNQWQFWSFFTSSLFLCQNLQEHANAKSCFEKEAEDANISLDACDFEEWKRLYALECRNVSLGWETFYASIEL